MRIKVDWRSSSKDNYKNFCKKNPSIQISFDDWRNIIYSYNEHFKNYILETGDKARLPSGFGEFSINKKKRKKIKTINGVEMVNYADEKIGAGKGGVLLQIHDGGGIKVYWRNIVLKKL